MKLNTNSLKVNQSYLEEGPTRYRTNDADSVKNQTERHSECRDCTQLMKGIVYIVLILLIIYSGFIVVFKVPHYPCVPSMCSTNAFVDSPVQTDDFKDDGTIQNPSAMGTMGGDPELKDEAKKAEIEALSRIKEDSIQDPVYWYLASSIKPSANKTKRSLTRESANSMDGPNLITSKRYKAGEQKLYGKIASKNLEPLDNFFDRMEILTSHIDRLHERYLTLNELNDDYVSQELSLSVETASTDDSIV